MGWGVWRGFRPRALESEYLDGPEADREEISRQVALAREVMQRYAPAMRELAR